MRLMVLEAGSPSWRNWRYRAKRVRHHYGFARRKLNASRPRSSQSWLFVVRRLSWSATVVDSCFPPKIFPLTGFAPFLRNPAAFGDEHVLESDAFPDLIVVLPACIPYTLRSAQVTTQKAAVEEYDSRLDSRFHSQSTGAFRETPTAHFCGAFSTSKAQRRTLSESKPQGLWEAVGLYCRATSFNMPSFSASNVLLGLQDGKISKPALHASHRAQTHNSNRQARPNTSVCFV